MLLYACLHIIMIKCTSTISNITNIKFNPPPPNSQVLGGWLETPQSSEYCWHWGTQLGGTGTHPHRRSPRKWEQRFWGSRPCSHQLLHTGSAELCCPLNNKHTHQPWVMFTRKYQDWLAFQSPHQALVMFTRKYQDWFAFQPSHQALVMFTRKYQDWLAFQPPHQALVMFTRKYQDWLAFQPPHQALVMFTRKYLDWLAFQSPHQALVMFTRKYQDWLAFQPPHPAGMGNVHEDWYAFLTPREKSPLPDAQRRTKPTMLHCTEQRAQTHYRLSSSSPKSLARLIISTAAWKSPSQYLNSFCTTCEISGNSELFYSPCTSLVNICL